MTSAMNYPVENYYLKNYEKFKTENIEKLMSKLDHTYVLNKEKIFKISQILFGTAIISCIVYSLSLIIYNLLTNYMIIEDAILTTYSIITISLISAISGIKTIYFSN